MKRNRRDARKYAFQFLYAQDISKDNTEIQFPEGETNEAMDQAYANQIIEGVKANMSDIDQTLEPFCKKRSFDRMDKVDRSILRVAIWELTYNKDKISPSIAINEAVQLAKDFGADASYKLINAILDAYVKSQK